MYYGKQMFCYNCSLSYFLSVLQIKIWFQNRRAKERRDTKKETYREQADIDDHNDTNKYSPSALDNTSEFLTSCRYTGSENISEERRFSSGQCRFSNQSETRNINENNTSSSMTYLLQARDCLQATPSISPPDWRMSAGSSFLQTVDVSPLTGNVNIDFELRM